jgi:hypothetical protein
MWRGTPEAFEKWKQRKAVKRWEQQNWRKQLSDPTRIPTGVMVRVTVSCNCGHKAELSLEFRGKEHRRLRCSKCGNTNPTVQRFADRTPRQARYHPGAATGPKCQ